MRKMFAGLMSVGFVLALTSGAFAETKTVTGRVVDEGCYKMDKTNTMNSHKMPKGQTEDCAAACAKGGKPLALLTDDGKVYEITGGLAADKNAKLIPHISHVVEIKGDVSEKDGKMMIASDALTMKSK